MNVDNHIPPISFNSFHAAPMMPVPHSTSPPVLGKIEYLELTMRNGRFQSLHIYLPPSYEKDNTRRFPVLYMHFGQHLFDPKHVGGDSWQLHRLIENLLTQGLIEEFVLIGIDAMRATAGTDQYHYVNLNEDEACQGTDYESMILDELIPYIDDRYRVLKATHSRAMIGACASATFTYNLAARHPEIFGKVGLLSPVCRSLFHERWTLGEIGLDQNTLCWIDVGSGEGPFVDFSQELVDKMLADGFRPGKNMFYLIEPDGFHSDSSWGSRMVHPLLLFFGSLGKPNHLRILGRDRVGTNGTPLILNTILEYETGFHTTLLDVDYKAELAGVVHIERQGRVFGESEGKTILHAQAYGLKQSHEIRVIHDLPNQVSITIHVKVIADKPEYANIYLDMLALKRTGQGCYMGTFRLKRGFSLLAKFSYDVRKFEQRLDGTPAPLRHVFADDDKTLEFVVERWPDPPALPTPARSVSQKDTRKPVISGGTDTDAP